MFRVPDYYRHVSSKLSQVMDDIGVNPRSVNVRRSTRLLIQAMGTLTCSVLGRDCKLYCLGSQIEGTTTEGLNSDTDILLCPSNSCVITDWENWVQGKHNFLMIQDEITPPGYCRLQVLRHDIPVALENIPVSREDQHVQTYTYDDQRRVLLKNTIVEFVLEGSKYPYVIHGPAATLLTKRNIDFVAAFPIRTKHALPWIEWREWYNPVMRSALEEECFVVGTGHPNSSAETIEWRISTSVAEKLMMMKMNITQLRCYVLLKIVVKSFITQEHPDTISSYHCKTVLMHCIENVPSEQWCEENLILCVTLCIQFLYNCVINNTCPHYFIPSNNLFEGRINCRTRKKIANVLKHILRSNGDFLLELRIDDIGQRLFVKLFQLVPNGIYNVLKDLFRCTKLFELYVPVFQIMLRGLSEIGKLCSTDERPLNEALYTLMLYAADGSVHRRAVEFLLPSLCTTMATCFASNCIGNGHQLSTRALSFFSMGIDSDVSSGRLKLASALLCSGDIDKTEIALRDVEERYDPDIVESLTGCFGTRSNTNAWSKTALGISLDLLHNDNINLIRSRLSFEVLFTRGESNCTPHGLRYEMFRCTKDEIASRDESIDKWMDYAVVDSLPFLWYLQYLTYGRLGKPADQQRALNNLINTIRDEPHLHHRETALNLLGQCMENENKLLDALLCYRWSLNERSTHNVARWHIANVLAILYNNNT